MQSKNIQRQHPVYQDVGNEGISEIRKISEDTDGIENDVEIGFIGDACIFEAGRVTLRVNLIDSDYPDITRVIPDENAAGIIKIKISRDAILHSLRRMAVYGTGCSMDIRNGSIYLEARDPEVGEIKDQLEVEDLGDDVDRNVKFNIKYLIEAIEAVSEEKVVLNMHDNGGPCVVCGDEDKNYTGIIMPLRD